ncbi:hypothetical protein BOX15_Mlig030943g1 [Macrostomum lignano]|uniref:Uncharacterized protein n=1 Tax=Macrostomum lignano TaxID=282301 RepID=A0A267ERI9_9PLAT|nr:hypothetical protein BOX15_Mlig030943g1 [Macrostomum lignano]
MAKGRHMPVNPSFLQVIGRIVRSPDSFPLLAALSTAATMLTGFITYQFYTRPDFKALRVSSNAKDGIDKPLSYHSNRLMWIGKKTNETPKEVNDIIKSVRSS